MRMPFKVTSHPRDYARGQATPMLALMLGALLLSASPLEAQDSDTRWVYRNIRQQYRSCDDWTGQCEYRWRYRQIAVPAPRYYAPRRDYDGDWEERRRQHRHCAEMRRAVGDQHLTVEGAKKAANDAWAGAVRFHLGEKYMDLSNARNVAYLCSRSSIKEGGVTTLGQSLTRCEIEAQPCRAHKEEAER